jgi:tripartite-type tricarboxylate transporter receptor subunit TctC
MFKIHSGLVASLFAAATLVSTNAHSAENYPTQPIKLVVPYPAGGTTDMIARIYAEGLAKQLKQPVIIDNKGGAATNIGSGTVAKASPDGYTLLFGTIGPFLNTILGPNPTFDPFKSLEPVASIVRLPYMLAANPSAPFSNVPELLELSRKNPGKYTVGSAQLNHYITLMTRKADFNILHIPYKGGGQAATGAMGGQVDMVYALVPLLKPQVESGTLKAIGLTSKEKLSSMPNVGTFIEAGTEFELNSWFTLFAPVGTPEQIQSQLSEATKSVVTEPAFVERMSKIGAQADWSDGGRA